jgi:hypothetical protein
MTPSCHVAERGGWTQKLLADLGIVPTGDLSSWPAIGSKQKVPPLTLREANPRDTGVGL